MNQKLRSELMDLLASMICLLRETEKKYDALSDCHAYYLRRSMQGGKMVFYRCKHGDSTGASRKYLGGPDAPEVLRIMQSEFYRKKKEILTENIRVTDRLLERFQSFDTETILGKLPKGYRAAYPKQPAAAQNDPAEVWLQNMNRLKRMHPPGFQDELTLVADDGTRVRSKAELVIANMLIALGIPYVYEAPLLIGGKWIHPDFMIYLESVDEICIIEHLGKMDDEEYAAYNGKRIGAYIQAGYRPDVNLLLSYEGPGGQDYDSRILRAKLIRLLQGERAA